MAIVVQPSSGLYRAVQYTGTNGAEIISALGATTALGPVDTLNFRGFALWAGLRRFGRLFNVPIGYWIVWLDDVNQYVVDMLSEAEFADQYQICDCSDTGADIAALQADVTTLQTDINNIDASQIVSGTLPFQRLAGTIAENQTVVLWNRPTLAEPGTAADSWQWRYNGVRTVYGNEYNLLRVRGIPDFQVPVRFMSNAARDGSSTLAIMQVSLSDAVSHLFQVMGNGDILGPGGASMLPTAPVAVTFNGVAGTANAATISDGAATGAPYAVATTLMAADNRVFLDGAVANPTGSSIAGGTVLFTITAAHRPTAWTQRIVRTSTALQARLTIKPNGEAVLDQALAAGATCSFDGVNWRKA